MYVCICNGHREADLRDIARRGVACANEAYRHLGGPPRCGRCLDLAQKVMDEVAGRTQTGVPSAALE